ncbi:MAG: ATP-binding cassette domain-containing protein [Thermoleophilia bacterium]|jgi:energy-coupling factor transport system ATP-binding protein
MRIEANKVSLFYQEGTSFESKAVSDVSLAIEAGERIGIAGPVGSGKSTLLALLAGIMAPTSGDVTHDGKSLGRRMPPKPGSVGFAFQSPENCLFEKTVFDDVAFAPRALELKDEEVRSLANGALAVVGLDAERFGARSPFSLSLGEQRRVALAGLLAMRPPVLLLDEPTAHLDPISRHDIIERLIRLNDDTGATVIMVGHDMEEMARFSKRLVIMDGGSIVADDEAGRLLTNRKLLERHSLMLPGTVEVCRLLGEATGGSVTPLLDESALVELLLKMAGGAEGDSCS